MFGVLYAVDSDIKRRIEEVGMTELLLYKILFWFLVSMDILEMIIRGIRTRD